MPCEVVREKTFYKERKNKEELCTNLIYKCRAEIYRSI